jgi:flagellar protein FlgJ
MKTVAQLPRITEARDESPKKRELKKACEDFEAIITSYLFKSMRETVPQSDEEEDGQAKDIYESMMDQSLAKELSHRPGLGLARTLYKKLAPLVEDTVPHLKSSQSSSDKSLGGENES